MGEILLTMSKIIWKFLTTRIMKNKYKYGVTVVFKDVHTDVRLHSE